MFTYMKKAFRGSWGHLRAFKQQVFGGVCSESTRRVLCMRRASFDTPRSQPDFRFIRFPSRRCAQNGRATYALMPSSALFSKCVSSACKLKRLLSAPPTTYVESEFGTQARNPQGDLLSFALSFLFLPFDTEEPGGGDQFVVMREH